MLFFIKPTAIHLDAYTIRPEIYNLFPVDYARKFIPDWWKQMPNKYEDVHSIGPRPTIKTCLGFNEYFKNGIVIPSWSELAVKIDPETKEYLWQFSDDRTIAGSHPYEQMAGFFNPDDWFHLKIDSPWVFSCKKDINWVWTQPQWCFEDFSLFSVPSAVINYKYSSGTNINLFIDRRRKVSTILPANQAMVNIIPMTEKKIVLHRHLVEPSEYARVSHTSHGSSFLNKYRKNKALTIANQSKCPFGFGNK